MSILIGIIGFCIVMFIAAKNAKKQEEKAKILEQKLEAKKKIEQIRNKVKKYKNKKL